MTTTADHFAPARARLRDAERRPTPADVPPTTAEGAKRLLAAAKATGAALTAELTRDAYALAERAAEIAGLGDAAHPGVRDAARVLAEQTARQARTIDNIMSKA